MIQVIEELKLWAFWLVKGVPGRIGCHVRRTLLPAKIGTGSRIWEDVQIDHPSRLEVGARSSINRTCILHCGGGVFIGNDVLVGPRVIIYSQNHEYHDATRPIHDQGYARAPVRVENDVWIAAGAILLPGTTIGTGAVVAAGAVVTKSVPPYHVVAGVPARVIGKREGTDVSFANPEGNP